MRFPGSGRLRVFVGRARNVGAVLAILLTPGPAALAQTAPVAGQNINMVSGTSWPGGDPFLQRQNEPSIAVSSRNPLHLLAGANDYRTVDLPITDTVPGSLAGDAWLGIFKSFDGGQTWQSFLHPGYPQDQSALGLASGLKAYSAAADPTVRAGTGGVFYYSGIAFNRGTNNGAVFVSTFFDGNVKENGDAAQGRDTIPYQSTRLVDTGTSGQFLDKTWIAVDIPRGTAPAQCTFNTASGTQTIAAGNVYLVWSRFTGSQSTKIMFSRSLDCGKTWSNPTKLSESSSINQGTNLAIDPASGKIYAVWRQFATSSNPDSIIVARSDDFGMTFPSKNTTTVATIVPFDQSMTATAIRTSALPSIAASLDARGNGLVHVAWAQRNPNTQDAQIVVSTSSNSGKTWSAPVPVDAGPLNVGGQMFARGHQFMPQITYAAGRLMVVYYDQRLDHTISLFDPNNPFVPDANGNFYARTQLLRGELESPGGTAGQNQVFTLFLDDALLTTRRHTIDLRVAEAVPSATPSFTSASVSQYKTGLWAPLDGVFYDDENQPITPQPGAPDDDGDTNDHVYQLQENVPNLPMFSLGTRPFLGDYIDLAAQPFVANANGTWSFNTSSSNAPVFYATWTDNRDVVPPIDPVSGIVDWTRYTPPASLVNAGDGTTTSIIDPTQKVPPCSNAFTGSRNQNIYMSRITEGLQVGSLQNAKPLSSTLERAFTVTLQNFTSLERSFHVTIGSQPAGGYASFAQGGGSPVQTTLDVTIPAHSGAARPVFAKSTNPAATIPVNVVETTAVNSLNLAGSVILNPEGSVSPLAPPDGGSDPTNAEDYTPSFSIINIANANPFINIANPNEVINIANINIANPDPAFINIANQDQIINIANINIANPDPAIINIANINIANTDAANINIANINIANTPVTDTTYAVTNDGNTGHSYRVALYSNNATNPPLQMIVTKNSSTPAAYQCTLQNQQQGVVVANVANAPIASTLAAATDTNIPDSSDTNATVALAPGEVAFVTLRGALTPTQMAQLVQHLTPVVTAHGANTGNVSASFALLLTISTVGGTTLPDALVGSPYSTTLKADGGTGTLTWTLTGGALPDGLTLSPAGTISGTPTVSGTFNFSLKVTDSGAVPQSATQDLKLTVNGRSTTTAVSLAPASVLVNQASVATATVTDTQSGGTLSSPAGTVNFSGPSGVTGGSCNLSQTAANQSSCTANVSASPAGSYQITGTYVGDPVHQTSKGNATLTVASDTTSSSIGFSSPAALVGQPVTVTVSVTNTAAGATTSPTGSVSLTSSVPTDTFTPAANCVLQAPAGGGTTSACSVSVTAASASPHTITANYAGVSGVFQTSTASLTLEISKRATATTVWVSPNPALAGQAATVTVTVTDAEAQGTKSSPAGTVTLSSTGADAFSPAGACTLVAGGAGVSGCSVSVSGTAVGVRTLSASYSGSGAYLASGGNSGWTVRGNTTTTITSDQPAPSGSGQSVTVAFAVAPAAPATGTPTGTVTVTDGSGGQCVATLPASSCSLVPGATGTLTLTATYSGDPLFNGSSGTRQHSVVAPYTFIGFLSPLSTAGTVTLPTNSGTGNFAKGLPIKWQLKDSSGNFVTGLTSTKLLQATYYVGGACTPGAATGTTFPLYSPTSGATGGSTFRYDSNNNQFLFNWSTKQVTTGPGCYELIETLNDGSAPRATQILLQ